MGQTLVEKILAGASGKNMVKPGEDILAKPDLIIAYDFPGYTDLFFRQLKEEFQIEKVTDPSRYILFIDHLVPPKNPADELLHINTRNWAGSQGATLIEGEGIGHQVSIEKGFALPGKFIVHFDGHISCMGVGGCLALGIRKNLIEAFACDSISLSVPETVKINLSGSLPKGCTGRDVFNYILSRIGPDGCHSGVMELAGPALQGLSIDSRITVCGLAMFVGAVSAIIAPDSVYLDFIRKYSSTPFNPLFSDDDAVFSKTFPIDISNIEPLLVRPPSPANVCSVSSMAGLELNQGYIGSCASGRVEDFQLAAQILKGKKIKSGFKLHIVPSSRETMLYLARSGIMEILIEAGAFISSPSCDYCFGYTQALAPEQRAISTGTLNVPGRLGSVEAEIYLASAATVAASAIEGKICDPRKYL